MERTVFKMLSCCIPDVILDDISEDERVLQGVSDALCDHVVSDLTPEQVAQALLHPTGMCRIAVDAEGVETVEVMPHSRPVSVQPRFVAHIVVALRCKLGLGAADHTVPGNVELVRREAAKMMRSMNVRDVDASAHLKYIERCFFEIRTHDALPEWRARAARQSRFVKWIFRDSAPQFDF